MSDTEEVSLSRNQQQSPAAVTLRRALVLVASLAVVAALAAGWFGWSWWNTTHGDQAQRVQARDAALEAGTQGLVNFSTLDHQDADKGLDRWARSATGPLLDGLNKARAQDAEAIRQAGTKTTGKVLSQALTELDVPAGRARMIGVVEVVVTPPQGQPVTKRNRLQADLTRTAAGWKLSGLGPVPVDA